MCRGFTSRRFCAAGVLGGPWGGCGPPCIIVGGAGLCGSPGNAASGCLRGQGGCTGSRVVKVRFQFQWNSHTIML